MSYASGGLIQATDYNNLAWGGTQGTYTSSPNNVAYVMGVGNGQAGYGQDLSQINTVAASGTVTAAQWAGFLYLLNRAAGHQSGTAGQVSTSGNLNMTAGETITYFANVSSAVTTINTNKLSFNNIRGSTTTGTNRDATWTSTSAAPTNFTQVRTVTFADADKMRYFFNAGGRINLVLTTVSGSDTGKEISWTNLLNNGVGTLSLDALTSERSGSGYTLTTNGFANGFWDLTTTDTTLFRLTDTTTGYSTNYVEVLAKVTGTAGSNGGKGSVLTLTINYVDASADDTYTTATPYGLTPDNISMTMRTRIDVIRPETTYLTDVWSTITEAATSN